MVRRLMITALMVGLLALPAAVLPPAQAAIKIDNSIGFATAPNQKWGVDISYVWTREGWLYLAVVIDLFSRRVVGWAVGDRLHRDLALAALRKALVLRRPPQGLIHHSDRGSQYCSVEYQAELRRHGIRISMSGKGELLR